MSFEAYETSSAQKRLYMINHILGDSILYNEVRVWTVNGKLNPDRLENAVKQISRRHEPLRTCFVMKDGQVLQKVYDHIDVDFKYTDWQMKAGELCVGETEKIIDYFLKPYDLEKVPLWKIELVQLKENQQLLLLDFHHIIADGTSMDVIINELTSIYQGKELPGPEAQYVDFTTWQNDLFQDEIIKEQEAYWLKMFAGEIPVPDLPTDYPRSVEMDISGNSIEFEFGDRLTSKVKQLASQHHTTLYVVLLTGLNVLLSRYSGQEDIVVGTPITGRSHREFENMVGMFVNTLAMRNQPAGDKTFKGFLPEVSQNAFEAFENQDYQFEMLVEKVAPGRQLNRNPLFDVIFALQNYAWNIDIADPGDEEIVLIPYHFKNRVSKFDLGLQAFEIERHIVFNLEYRTSLFHQDTIQRLAEHFTNIFREVTENCDLRLSEIKMISEVEREHMLYLFNDTAMNYPAGKTVDELFEEQVERIQDNIAVVGPPQMKYRTYMTYMTHISYRELNKQSTQLAYLLKEKGVKPGTIVGIMVERSVEMIIGLLGILKAGSAYLPIDPDYPEERKQYILNDSNAKVFLSAPDLASAIEPTSSTLTSTSTCQVSTTNLAYILYTSGSTGRPKGVMVQHQNVVRLVKNSNFIDFSADDRLLLTGAIVFDITTFEIWGPLLNGLMLVLADQDVILDAEKLGDFIIENEISILHLIPQLFNQLATQQVEIFAGLRYFLVGGDLVRPKYVNLLRNMYKGIKILHMYGPTENTTFSTFFPVDKVYEERIPIGKPIGNSCVYILDSYRKLQPIGVVGELCTGGDGVARGYLNNPELTAEIFFSISYKSYKSYRSYISKKIYKTGDLARWLPDGNIEFIGRIDQQVKIRGIRIELGEIENALRKHSHIEECFVITREINEDIQLILYYKEKNNLDPGLSNDRLKVTGGITSNDLREFLVPKLPGYMIPSYFVKLEEIPLTPNGKIDCKALPEPEFEAGQDYTLPRDEIEKKLLEIWLKVLNRMTLSIGIDDDFFKIGGHSLKAALLTAYLHQEFEVKVPLAEIFMNPTIRGLAKFIKNAVRDQYTCIKTAERMDYYPLSPAQKGILIHQKIKPDSTAYNSVSAWNLEGTLDKDKFQETLKKLILRHESLRTSFQIVKGKPVQKIHEQFDFEIEYFDFKMNQVDIKVEDGDKEGTRGLAPLPTAYCQLPTGFIRPFDLSRLPLLRVGLIKTGDTRHILILDIHHIITDGVSQDLFVKEFISCYEGLELPRLRIQYKDYALWLNSQNVLKTKQRQRGYWLQLFEGEVPVLDMPCDFKRPDVETFSGEMLTFILEKELSEKLNRLAKEKNTTLFIVLLAAYTILLSKYTGQEDIVVGTPVSGRRHMELQNIIGMFVNMLVIRNRPSDNKTFKEFLTEVKETIIQAVESQDFHFEELVKELGLQGNPGRNPLFDVVFAMQNVDMEGNRQQVLPTSELYHLQVTPYEFQHTVSQFDLILGALQGLDTITLNLRYATTLFKPSTAKKIFSRYQEILEQIVENNDIQLKAITITHDLLTADSALMDIDEEEGEFEL